MGLGQCLCAASTRSSSGTWTGTLLAEQATGQAEGWWRSASPLPCAPSLEAPAAIEKAAEIHSSGPLSGRHSPDVEDHPLLPSAPPMPSADDIGSDKVCNWSRLGPRGPNSFSAGKKQQLYASTG